MEAATSKPIIEWTYYISAMFRIPMFSIILLLSTSVDYFRRDIDWMTLFHIYIYIYSAKVAPEKPANDLPLSGYQTNSDIRFRVTFIIFDVINEFRLSIYLIRTFETKRLLPKKYWAKWYFFGYSNPKKCPIPLSKTKNYTSPFFKKYRCTIEFDGNISQISLYE